MHASEIRHRLVGALLQADAPLALTELVAAAEVEQAGLHPVLQALVSEGLVVEGELTPGQSGPQYWWAAWWAQEAGRRAAGAERELRHIVDARPQELAIDSEAVLAFNEYVINEYQPPAGKRLLVFFQCSVRRPFSTSPSHASMRRAVAVATGCDPARDFEQCPVHVVVLASHIGPVPYELENVYPANVGGGVKHFSADHYCRVRPILAARIRV